MGILITLSCALQRAGLCTTMMLTAFMVLVCGIAQAQEKKPNILVIMGDDIG